MKKFSIVFVIILILAACFPWAGGVQADGGVGISPGSIQVDQDLSPGGYYQLPSLQVMNTGNEPLQYEVVLTRMADQDELQPDENFVSFSPNSFYLEPGENKVISLSLNIPIKAEPGDYLAYIEAHPATSLEQGGTTIRLAAATKLYFSVSPSSTWAGMVNSVASFFKRNAPVSFIVPGIIILGILVYFINRRLKLEFKMTRR